MLENRFCFKILDRQTFIFTYYIETQQQSHIATYYISTEIWLCDRFYTSEFWVWTSDPDPILWTFRGGWLTDYFPRLYILELFHSSFSIITYLHIISNSKHTTYELFCTFFDLSIPINVLYFWKLHQPSYLCPGVVVVRLINTVVRVKQHSHALDKYQK